MRRVAGVPFGLGDVSHFHPQLPGQFLVMAPDALTLEQVAFRGRGFPAAVPDREGIREGAPRGEGEKDGNRQGWNSKREGHGRLLKKFICQAPSTHP